MVIAAIKFHPSMLVYSHNSQYFSQHYFASINFALATNPRYSFCMTKPTSTLNHVLGPPSSHSSGALLIGRLCRDLRGGNVTAVDCDYDPNGSLAKTHLSLGCDLGLTVGLLGWESTVRPSHSLTTFLGV